MAKNGGYIAEISPLLLKYILPHKTATRGELEVEVALFVLP